MITPWYDMKTGMSREIGETLIVWANCNMSHPANYTADEWTALLYMHGCTLLRYGDSRIPDDDYYTNYFPFMDEYQVSEYEAKASMQWVVDHFYTLWD